MLVDISIVVIVIATAVFGFFRGFIREILSLSAWIIALYFAWQGTKSKLIYPYLEPHINQTEILAVASFIVLFVTALIGLSVIAFLLHKIFDMVEVSGVNKALGFLFGGAKGLVLCAIIILGCNFINLPSKSWWQESQLVNHFIPLTDFIHSFLPQTWQEHIPTQKPISRQSIQGV